MFTNQFTLDSSIDYAPVAAGGSVAGIIDRAGGVLSVSGGMLQFALTDGADYFLRPCYVPNSDTSTDQEVEVEIPANPLADFSFSAITRLKNLNDNGRVACYYAGFKENYSGTPRFHMYWTGRNANFGALINPTIAEWYDRTIAYVLRFRSVGTFPTVNTLEIREKISGIVKYTGTVEDSTDSVDAPLQSEGFAGISTAGMYGQGGGPFATPSLKINLQAAVPALVVPSPVLVSRTSNSNTISVTPTGGTAPYSYAWHRKLKDFDYSPSSGTLISGATTQQITNAVTSGELWMYKCVVTDATGTSATSDYLMVETLPASRGPLPPIADEYKELIYFGDGDSITTNGLRVIKAKQFMEANGVTKVIAGNAGFQGDKWIDWRPNAAAATDGRYTGSINPETGNTYSSEYGGAIPGANSLAKALTIFDDLLEANPGIPAVVSLMLGMNDQLNGTDPALSLTAAQEVIAAFLSRGERVKIQLESITWAYTANNGPSRANATAALALRDQIFALADNERVFTGFTDYYYDLYKNGLTVPYYGSDYVHFLPAGYDIVGPVQGESVIRRIAAEAEEPETGVGLTPEEKAAIAQIPVLVTQSQAQSEQIANLLELVQTLSGGTGARTVRIETGIAGARVRVTKGAQVLAISADFNGVAMFALDDGVWSYAVTAAGYMGVVGSITVNGNETEVVEMEPLPDIPPSTVPGMVPVRFSGVPFGLSGAGLRVTLEIKVPVGAKVAGRFLTDRVRTVITGEDAVALFNAWPSSVLEGAGYSLTVERGGTGKFMTLEFTVPDGGGDVADLVN